MDFYLPESNPMENLQIDPMEIKNLENIQALTLIVYAKNFIVFFFCLKYEYIINIFFNRSNPISRLQKSQQGWILIEAMEDLTKQVKIHKTSK